MSPIENMMEMSPGTILANPADFVANGAVAMGFSWWAGGFALLVLPWIFIKLSKHKDPIPLFMWLGGLICSLLEPMLDHLGHLWWAVNLPGPIFSGYDLHIPYLIPPCYIFFIAMTGYWACSRFEKGLDVKGVFLTYFAIAMTDVVMEIPGTSLGAYKYYGDAPTTVLGFPLFWGWINGLSMLSVGFLLWLVKPYLQGSRKLLVLLVPIVGMGAAYGMAAWPYFMALNWPMPVYATWLLTFFSLGLSLIIVRGIAGVVAHAAATKKLPMDSLAGKKFAMA